MRLDPGGIAYGTISLGGVLAVESVLQETYASTLGGAAIALMLYWLGHSYAEFTRRRATSHEPLRLRGLLGIIAEETSVLFGAAIPFLVLVACDIAGASLSTGVDAATWTAAGMIVVIEVGLGLRERLSGSELAVQSALGLTLGLLVLALHALLH